MRARESHLPTQELSGTTALVTGPSPGSGRAIAIAMAGHGAHVVVGVARDRARLEELRAQLVDRPGDDRDARQEHIFQMAEGRSEDASEAMRGLADLARPKLRP
jgi:NAD(P)-dependent dehydrogenase (short-subunit alcohol dehydrogenase family)